MKYNDYPIEECADACEKIIATGGTIHQKYTCAKCGSRQAMEEPNKFFTTGTCGECGHVTDIAKQGCNYLVHFVI